MKRQAGVQVSRPRELRRHLQLWKYFGRLYFLVIVLDRNIDPENFGDKKRELILDIVEDRLSDDWFTGTTDNGDDLDCVVDYLELQSHNNFVDIKDEAYKKRMCKLLDRTYKEPSPITIERSR
ncbi:hypothetical protein Tco_0661768 [Tanacetum coccineum]